MDRGGGKSLTGIENKYYMAIKDWILKTISTTCNKVSMYIISSNTFSLNYCVLSHDHLVCPVCGLGGVLGQRS